MPIKVLELHHHGIRIGPSDDAVKQAKHFYGDVLGLETDQGRPNIPGIPGFWMYVGNEQNSAQIHLMGAEGQSSVAHSEKEDPTIPHVALAVENIQEAKQTLDRESVWYWEIQGLVGDNSAQVSSGIRLATLSSCTKSAPAGAINLRLTSKVSVPVARRRVATCKNQSAMR